MASFFTKKRKRILFFALLIYFIGALVIHFGQEKIIFQSKKYNSTTVYNFQQPHREISIPYNETDTIHLVQFYRADTSIASKGLVLFFHGNKYNIEHYASYAQFFGQQQYDALLIDYPGYGKSRGQLSENTLYDWCKQAYQLAAQWYNPSEIIVYGKSLGTALATHIASIYNCKSLILETPYYDFPSVFNRYAPIYPNRLLLDYELPTHKYLEKVTVPITIFHGTSDGVVAYKNSKRLAKLLKPHDELVTIKGGSHNNLMTYPQMTDKLKQLLTH